MVEKSVEIQLESGLEARPVAVLVQVASQFKSSVYLEAEGRKVNAKSIMGMMTLGLNTGETVKVLCDGDDEETAAENIENFLSGKMQSA
ncbi:MAG: HPr family phosphocarrier protein [Clostridiales bacterium]|nr:HPr family phosphocarrier protein [Clostridiales bacterium]